MSLQQVKDDPQLGRPLPLKYSQIERFVGQPRRYFDPDSISALADSISKEGQNQPVKVSTNPGKKGSFTLIDGERRHRAFELIYERTGVEPVIDAFVTVVKDLKEHFRLSTIANLFREDLSPLDEAAALHRLKEDGETEDGLAKLRGKSKTYVQGYVKLHGMSDEVKKMMDLRLPKDKRLSPTSAIDIARSTENAQLRLELAQEVVARNLGVVEARQLMGVRTEDEGYRFGGRFRKPSDDYAMFKSSLGRLTRDATRHSRIDMDGLYFHRDDERGDRKHDAAVLRHAIHLLQSTLEKIEK